MKLNIKISSKEIKSHIIVIVGFILLSTAYFWPVTQGKVLNQHDVYQAQAMGEEAKEYFEKDGETILWTNRMFSGMPTVFMGNVRRVQNNIFKPIGKAMLLGLPSLSIGILFITLLVFFITLRLFNVNIWLSAIGAIAFAFSSYNVIIIGAGHVNKSYAIAYLPLILGGVILAFRKKYYLAALITILGMGLEIFYNHVQITYYLGIAILIYVIIQFYSAIKEKTLKHSIIASAILLASVALSIAPGTANLWTTYEYSQHSTRGGTELTKSRNETQTNSGLDFDYVTAWSNEVLEVFTVLVPDLYGGSSNRGLSENSKTYKELRSKGVAQADKIVKNLPTYWGDMPFTSGPVYFGAIICFLFVLSMFVIDKKLKIWALITSILMMGLSMGDHLESLSRLFFNYFPMYDKFRTVSMILVIPSLIFPFVGFLGLKKILSGEVEKQKALTYIKKSVIIVGGLLVIFLLFGGTLFSFSGKVDDQLLQGGYPQWLIDTIREDRAGLMKKDSFRSLVLILLAAGLIWLFIKSKIKKETVLYLGLGFLILFDLWGVNKRYVNDDNFVDSKKELIKQPKYPANEFILQDKEPYYRVLSLNNPFNETQTTQWHYSIGGYHAAKINNYQEIIDYYIAPEMSIISKTLSSADAGLRINSVMANFKALNMLNTKYIIYNQKAQPLLNNYRFGNAWFVDSIMSVENADDEIESIRTTDIRNIAIVNKKFSDRYTCNSYEEDSSAYIKLTSYHPEHLEYESNSNVLKTAVFSEVYYDAGWLAYIDGEEVPYFRVNHILRGLEIPAGKHEIKFEFKPKSYFWGTKISLISSIIVVLVIAFLIYKLTEKKNSIETID